MKKVIMGAAFIAAMAAMPAMATDLIGATATLTYANSNNITATFNSPTASAANVCGIFKFYTSDVLYSADFWKSGLLNIADTADGSELTPRMIGDQYTMIFDFGSSLGSNSITSVALTDGTLVSGSPVFTVLSGHSFSVDLGKVVWGSEGSSPAYFNALSAQIDVAAVPEPGIWPC